MPHITYLRADGTSDTVDVPLGTSVMRGAVREGVAGIVAECGGAGMCGTCHIFLPEHERVARGITPIHPLEDEVLEITSTPRRATSRLGCQLAVTEQCDGLTVELPEHQVLP
ncbi:2Fe-2S iron-sulfur cluster-binding protein [Actinocrinis sp.]|uniref:2Fe-2S iron-sulfur cluster-binding protein n=1 Tax=Actinocrinis sp. TaxID=1920516 RepID=UPI002D6C97E1|nr:2Fe-2S iron-sulfur cluster-binding protein [Actinocrinis sp.]HZP50530.1 2Fe-2S iron-sulfur cluster-binding protein [Actinocrinis sp.]